MALRPLLASFVLLATASWAASCAGENDAKDGAAASDHPGTVTPDGGTGPIGPTTDAPFERTTGAPYDPTCEEQQCTAEETCLTGPAGTYCVHPCPGQPCPPSGPRVPYCTRQGGVICGDQ